MTILVIAEHNGSELHPNSYATYAAALEIGNDINVLVIGEQCVGAVEQAKTLPSCAKVLIAESAVFKGELVENTAPMIAAMKGDYSHILAPASTYGKAILPAAAALADRQQISDIIEIKSTNQFVRLIYAGNAMQTVESEEDCIFITVRATAFELADKTGGEASVENVSAPADSGKSIFVENMVSKSDRPELTTADIVISGGRGMKAGENFAMLEKIADKLGAAVGASRAAVDAGYVSNNYQVGQTGKVVAPNLYIAVGISGAIQHLAGMKDSKTIVAINNDADAPIFQVADYGLVADLFEAIPELEKNL
ncbi:MAG: FAD-binding protein [Alphaproteobacteria bacterium]|nr:FAD-binding protein [Alphaproteobacteria bacterium]